MNRGVEIDSAVADGPQSLIREQVEMGVAVRMAVLEALAAHLPNATDAAMASTGPTADGARRDPLVFDRIAARRRPVARTSTRTGAVIVADRRIVAAGARGGAGRCGRRAPR